MNRFLIDQLPEYIRIDTSYLSYSRAKRLVKEFRVYDMSTKDTFYGRNLTFIFFQIRYNRLHKKYLVKKYTLTNE